MEWLGVGIIVGLVMGLTGAGGAIVAVPLFTVWLGISVKEATVLALPSVIAGSVLNWLFQRQGTQVRLSLGLAVGALLGARLMALLKPHISEGLVTLSFITLCAYCVWAIWQGNTNKTDPSKVSPVSLARTIFFGMILGALTTLTGLGGGVVLMPWLIGVFKVQPAFAVPTSLLTIAATGLWALLFQWGMVSQIVHISEVGALVVGVLASVAILRFTLLKLPAPVLTRLRQIVLTVLVALSVGVLVFR